MTLRKLRDPNVIRAPEPPQEAPFWLVQWLQSFLLTFEALRQVVIDHHSIVKPFITAQTGSYTTTGNAGLEIVDCTGTTAQTITLHTPIKDGQQVFVKRSGTGAVTIETAGTETIDADTAVTLGTKAGLHLYAIEDKTKWIKT